MKIDESIRELEKARDSIEPCLFIDEALDQSMKTAVEIMRKYQKIEEIARWNNSPSPYYKPDGQLFREICEVLEDGNVNNKI